MSFGAVGGAVLGGVASAGASSLIGGMFGGEDDVSSAYDPQIQALSALGAEAGKIGRRTARWAEQSWGDLDSETAEILARLEPIAAEQTALAQGVSDMPQWLSQQGQAISQAGTALTGYGDEAIGRHREVYQPLENEWIQDYRNYASGDRMAQEEARASADAAQSFEASRENALRQLEGYGIDPSQARYGALDMNVRLAQAATQAQMQTDARRHVEETGRQMRTDILNYGSQYPGWGQQYSQLGLAGQESGANVGREAVDAAQGVSDIYGDIAKTRLSQTEALNNLYRTGVDLSGAASPYYDSAGGSYGGAGKLTGGQQADMAAERERFDPLGQNIGSALGDTVSGAFNTEGGAITGGSPYSGQPLGNSPVVSPAAPTVGAFGYAQGGEIEGPGGPYTDSVQVKASDGEYMVPYEVVHRKGTEFFDKLVDKTRQDLQALPA